MKQKRFLFLLLAISPSAIVAGSDETHVMIKARHHSRVRPQHTTADKNLVASGVHGDDTKPPKTTFPTMDFAEAASVCHTDKVIIHHYEYIYDSALRDLLWSAKKINKTYPENPALRIAEIGVASFGGLCVARRWLGTNIVYDGFEYDKGNMERFASSIRFVPPNEQAQRLKSTYWVDQCSSEAWDALMKPGQVLDKDKLYDIIIDDGCHASHCIKMTLMRLWSKLKPGGIYMIEDTAFSSTKSFKLEYSGGTGEEFHQWFRKLVSDLQYAALEEYYSKDDKWRQWLVPHEDPKLLTLQASVPWYKEIQRIHCEREACYLQKMIPGAYELPNDIPTITPPPPYDASATVHDKK